MTHRRRTLTALAISGAAIGLVGVGAAAADFRHTHRTEGGTTVECIDDGTGDYIILGSRAVLGNWQVLREHSEHCPPGSIGEPTNTTP